MRFLSGLAAISILTLSPSYAADTAASPPFEFALDMSKDAKRFEHRPLEKADKKWNVCALIPHLKDSYWVSVGYGLVSEAERLGVGLRLFQAGGYDQLPKQISQFDDCLAGNPDAIILAPISEAGLSAKLKQVKDRGIATLGLINPLSEGNANARITNDQFEMGRVGGEAVKHLLGEAGGNVVAFPGPQGSGWAEKFLAGFKDALKGSKVNVLADKFGDTGVSVQLRLVEDALQTYPKVDAIWGSGPTAEAAVGAVAEAGTNTKIFSSYADQSSVNLLKRGQIAGFVSDSPVVQARAAVNQAVRILEKKPYEKFLVAPPILMTKKDITPAELATVLAPDNWKPVFSSR